MLEGPGLRLAHGEGTRRPRVASQSATSTSTKGLVRAFVFSEREKIGHSDMRAASGKRAGHVLLILQVMSFLYCFIVQCGKVLVRKLRAFAAQD